MKKIICIGECSLNIVLGADGKPAGSLPGGRVLNAAAILARDSFEVLMASEVSADAVGDIIVRFLEDSGVKLDSLDRFTEGRTPVNIFTTDKGSSAPSTLTRYEAYPDECFDIIWPRIDEGDIVLFGGYYAIDSRMRQRLVRFLNNAVERKAILIYLPGFLPQQEPRITRVMPAILENLEMANVVVARNNDLKLIFGIDNTDTCYHNHIDFYCRSLVSVDAACSRISYYTGKEMSSVEIPASTSRTMMWNSGAVAGIAGLIAERALGADDFEAPSQELREAILGAAALSANKTAASYTEDWQLF
jgi:Sugar kinases, ribokinase family